MELQGRILSDEIQNWVNSEVQTFLNQNYAGWGFPPLKKTGKKGDFTLIVGEVCGKRKLNPKEFTDKLANELIGYVNSNKNSLIQKVEATAPGYLNLWINRTFIYSKAVKAVLALSDGYGKLDVMKGKKVIVEHTSANPNGPLHIGNLRNVILGGILANILQNVGYDVKQHFYVNDLGAQIGLTALGFVKIYNRLEPKLKIDQWIGMIYAIMNTFVELQALGQNLVQLYDIVNNSKCVELHQKNEAVKQYVASLQSDSKEKIEEFFLIFVDLRDRQPELFDALYAECKGNPNLKKSGAELNLRYESNDPEAVKIFRKMVIADLTGMQQTLDIFGIKHDRFDFESELGWEGSNDRVLDIMKASPYFSPPTQSNAKGVPEGGYLDLDQFIKDKKLPQGKKGYQPDYPPLYVLRPDGSTLYTFRDVVYSLKKVAKSDMVLNVIASEQNVAQEKVALSLELIDPGKPRKQFHVSYDLVKLLNDEGAEVKMSGRRARYVLADDVYEELRSVLRQLMIAKFAEKGKPEDPELFETVINEVSTAAIKYALVSMSCRSKINFNIKKVCDFDDSSAPFLLYNATRFFSLFRKYEKGVQDGVYPALPPLDQIDWTLLNQDGEWELMWDFILGFPSLIQFIACPQIPDAPTLPEFNVHLLCDFLISLVRSFSKYWAATKILKENPSKEEAAVMVARLYLLKSVQLVLNNGLKMLTITPLEKM